MSVARWDGCSERRRELRLDALLQKAKEGGTLSRSEVIALLALPTGSAEALLVMAMSKRLSEQLTPAGGEVHGQLVLNWWPCSRNCAFCAMAVRNGRSESRSAVSIDDAVCGARALESDGSAAIYVRSTGRYPIGEYLRCSEAIRDALQPDTLLVAHLPETKGVDLGDLQRVGFQGAYHSLRMREGKDTHFSPDSRIRDIARIWEAGLPLGTAVGPVGPEHTNEELADAILASAQFAGAFTGVFRRPALPVTVLTAKHGTISDLRLAQLVSVARLATPRRVRGLAVNMASGSMVLAGANVMFSGEVGLIAGTDGERELHRELPVGSVFRTYHGVHTPAWTGPSSVFTDKDAVPRKAMCKALPRVRAPDALKLTGAPRRRATFL